MGLVKFTNNPKRWLDTEAIQYVEVDANATLRVYLITGIEIKVYQEEEDYESLLAIFERILTAEELEQQMYKENAMIDCNNQMRRQVLEAEAKKAAMENQSNE